MADTETYLSIEGDTVDLISFNRFGDVPGQVELVLAANPGLAELGPILPMGTVVILPVPETLAREDSVRLWD